MAGGPRFGLQADLVLPGKCWIRVGAVCEEARGIEIPAPESESLAAPLPPWLLKPPCEFGWLLASGLGAEAVGGGGGGGVWKCRESPLQLPSEAGGWQPLSIASHPYRTLPFLGQILKSMKRWCEPSLEVNKGGTDRGRQISVPRLTVNERSKR